MCARLCVRAPACVLFKKERFNWFCVFCMLRGAHFQFRREDLPQRIWHSGGGRALQGMGGGTQRGRQRVKCRRFRTRQRDGNRCGAPSAWENNGKLVLKFGPPSPFCPFLPDPGRLTQPTAGATAATPLIQNPAVPDCCNLHQN